MGEISYDELYYLINEKNEVAEKMLFDDVEKYLQWLCLVKGNDYLRTEDIMSYGWQGYIEAFQNYNPKQTTTFKSFMQFCINRRLIDIQRRRNKKSLKGHMSSLLISDERVAYVVECKTTTTVTDENLLFELFWENLSKEEQIILKKYTMGVKIQNIAEQLNVSVAMMYKKIRQLKEKLKRSLLSEE